MKQTKGNTIKAHLKNKNKIDFKKKKAKKREKIVIVMKKKKRT
jgi:hypothetical protein